MNQGQSIDLILSSLRIPDSSSCLHCLKDIEKQLKTDGFVDYFAERSPQFKQITDIWDAYITSQNQVLIEKTLVVTADIIKASSSASSAHTQAAGKALATAILSRSLKPIYFSLSSGARTRASAAFYLLAALASLGPSYAGELLRSFDFTLSALPNLCRPPKPGKQDAANFDNNDDSNPTTAADSFQARIHKQWASTDPTRRPTRATFILFAHSLLSSLDSVGLAEALSFRSLIGGILNFLSSDPPVSQLVTLQILQNRVLALSSPAVKAEAFGVGALIQLATIASTTVTDNSTGTTTDTDSDTSSSSSSDSDDSDGDDSSEDDDTKKDTTKQRAVANEQKRSLAIKQQVAVLAYTLVQGLCVDERHGVCATDEEVKKWKLMDASSALSPQRRTLLRWLLQLKPTDSTQQYELIISCTARDPALAASFLLSLTWLMEPTPTGKWLTHCSLMASVLKTLGDFLVESGGGGGVGFEQLAQRGEGPPSMTSKPIQAMLRVLCPPALQRTALSRGVQHNNPLVRHSTMNLLCTVLHLLHTVLQDIATALRTASGGTGQYQEERKSNNNKWEVTAVEVCRCIRGQLPDVQPILAQLSTAAAHIITSSSDDDGNRDTKMKATYAEKQKLTLATTTTEKQQNIIEEEKEQEQEEDDEDNVDIITIEEDVSLRTKNMVLLSVSLRTLQYYRMCLPAVFQESRIDTEKLIPLEILAVPYVLQYQYLSLVLTTYPLEHNSLSLYSSGQALSQVLPILKVLTGTTSSSSGTASVWELGRKWAVQRLYGMGVFQGNTDEITLWLDLLPSSGICFTACTFLLEAAALVQRRPEDFYDIQQQILSSSTTIISGTTTSATSTTSEGVEYSLLALCALRQVLRILPSTSKMPIAEKKVVVGYIVVVLVGLIQQQREPERLARVLLAVIDSEEQRSVLSQAAGNKKNEDGGDGKTPKEEKEKKRKRKDGDDNDNDKTSGLLSIEDAEGVNKPLLKLRELLQALVTTTSTNVSNVSNDSAKKKKKRNSNVVDGDISSTNSISHILKKVLKVSSSTIISSSIATPSQGFLFWSNLLFNQKESAVVDQSSMGQRASAILRLYLFQWTVTTNNSNKNDEEELKLVLTAAMINNVIQAAITNNNIQQLRQAVRVLSHHPTILSFFSTAVDNANNAEDSSSSSSSSMLTAVVVDVLAAMPTAYHNIFTTTTTGSTTSGSEELREDCAVLLNTVCSRIDAEKEKLPSIPDVVLAKIITLVPLLSTEALLHIISLSTHYLVSIYIKNKTNDDDDDDGADEKQKKKKSKKLKNTEQQQQQQSCSSSDGVVLLYCKCLEQCMDVLLSRSSTSGTSSSSNTTVSIPLEEIYAVLVALHSNTTISAVEQVLATLLLLLLKTKQQSSLNQHVLYYGQQQQRSTLLLLSSCLTRQSQYNSSIAASLISFFFNTNTNNNNKKKENNNNNIVNDDGSSGSNELVVFAAKELRKQLETLSAVEGGAIAKRQGLAFLLPPAHALLLHIGKTTTKEKKPAKPPTEEEEEKEEATKKEVLELANDLLVPLIGFLTSKPTSTTATTTAALQADAAVLLHSYCIPCLRLVLSLLTTHSTTTTNDATASNNSSSIEKVKERCRKGLNKLVSTTHGWLITTEMMMMMMMTATTTGGNSCVLYSTVEEKADTVGVLLGYVYSGGGTGKESIDADVVKELVPLLETFKVTLLTLAKNIDTTQPHNTPAALQQLQYTLLHHLDTSLGDTIASLSSPSRTSPHFVPLFRTSCDLVTGLMKKKALVDDVVLCVLRRFMAAFLPDDDDDDKDNSIDTTDSDSDNGQNNNNNKNSVDDISNIDVVVEAGKLLLKILTHSRFAATLRCSVASPPELPRAAKAAKRPVESVLVFADCALGQDPSAAVSTNSSSSTAATATNSSKSLFAAASLQDTQPFTTTQGQGDQQAVHTLLTGHIHQPTNTTTNNTTNKSSSSSSPARLKKELLDLLETLLDLQDRYTPTTPTNTNTEYVEVVEQIESAEERLLRAVMAGYGGSCSTVDVSSWSLASVLNMRLYRRGITGNTSNTTTTNSSMDVDSDDDDDKEAVMALLNGPLAASGFAFGPSALTTSWHQQQPNTNNTTQSSSSVLQNIDPVRCALTVIYFPTHRSFTSILQPTTTITNSSTDTTTTNEILSPPYSPCGYDPIFLLLLCITHLRNQTLSLRHFVRSGLLSVCLRCLAAEHAVVRAMACEVLSIAYTALSKLGGTDRAVHNTTGTGTIASFGTKAAITAADFKERQQISILLSVVQNTLEKPFTRIPDLHAVLFAESALVLASPTSPMYPTVCKFLLKAPSVDVTTLPSVFSRLILSGSQQHVVERGWCLRLIAAGLRGVEDAVVCRRGHVLEMAMAVFDMSVMDKVVRHVALRTLCIATLVPRAARYLAEENGGINWFTNLAETSIKSGLQAGSRDGVVHAVCALTALSQLSRLKSVLRLRGAGNDLVMASLRVFTILKGLSSPPSSTITSHKNNNSQRCLSLALLPPTAAAAALQLWIVMLTFLESVSQSIATNNLHVSCINIGTAGSSSSSGGGGTIKSSSSSSAQAVFAKLLNACNSDVDEMNNIINHLVCRTQGSSGSGGVQKGSSPNNELVVSDRIRYLADTARQQQQYMIMRIK